MSNTGGKWREMAVVAPAIGDAGKLRITTVAGEPHLRRAYCGIARNLNRSPSTKRR